MYIHKSWVGQDHDTINDPYGPTCSISSIRRNVQTRTIEGVKDGGNSKLVFSEIINIVVLRRLEGNQDRRVTSFCLFRLFVLNLKIPRHARSLFQV